MRSPFVCLALAVALAGCSGSSGAARATDDGGTPTTGAGDDASASIDGAIADAAAAPDAAASLDGGAPSTGGDGSTTGAGFCNLPTNASSTSLNGAYNNWKTTFVTSSGDAGTALRVLDPNDTTNKDRTVSEGIGYGMIIAAYMNDRPLFDGLWAFEQAHLDTNGLMNWLITAADTTAGSGGATDADEDMAWALLIADQKWPGNGYLDLAKAQIDLVLSLEIDSATNLVKWGDLSRNTTTVHPDYFAPAYYRAFGAATGNAAPWNAAITAGYALIKASQNTTTGLVPDLCLVSGAPTSNAGDAVFGYDACRTPWRLGVDWCLHGSPDAQASLTLMATYFAGVGAAKIVGPVALDGTMPTTTTAYANAEFTGPAGVAGMVSPSYQMFLNSALSRTSSQVGQSTPNYFGSSVGLISMIVMNGAFVDYAP